MVKKNKASTRYEAIIEKIFFSKYNPGDEDIPFERDDMRKMAKSLKVNLPKNLGDVIYSMRYRTPMPSKITATQTEGREWIIEGRGKSLYSFILVAINRLVPNKNLVAIKVPDSTPEIISAYALSDEQALLAKLRYNRLLDIFLGIATYSLQNHLRTTVQGLGQVEIDEIYVGIDKRGCQFVLPVQAKGGNDQLSAVQAKQDIACCMEKFPDLLCRSISAQFISSNLIALFELTIEDGMVKIVEEKHYRLVPADQITKQDLKQYSTR
ncbi:MAG TPA: endonuclease [Synergistaceae bacterium]|nr:endonuclease [Synergistaceae bacterium]